MTTDVVVRGLAVVGGGVVGGFGLGLFAQLLARTLTAKKLSRGPVLIVRLLSGVICGWLIALWLFGGGGSGIGGLGGWGLGSGAGKGDGEKTTEIAKKDHEVGKDGSAAKAPTQETLRIEVLGKDTLKKMDADAAHCYRLETENEPRLLTFEGIKEEIRKRQRQQPPLRRIEIVLYNDSPDKSVNLVSQLRTWASDLNNGKMKVDISEPDANAPTR